MSLGQWIVLTAVVAILAIVAVLNRRYWLRFRPQDEDEE